MAGFFETLTEWDPYTPLDAFRDVTGEIGSTARTGIETGGEVGVAVSDQLPAAAGKAAFFGGLGTALGAATIPVTVGGVALAAYVIFLDPGLPARTWKNIRG